ncbi:MAG: tyrosine-protein phosphatase [Bryobacteraceae bacterium]
MKSFNRQNCIEANFLKWVRSVALTWDTSRKHHLMNNLKKTTVFASVVLSLSISAWPALAQTPAIPNFHQVNDHVYRGGQPGSEAWQSLAKMGVKTVIDLRREDEHSTAEEGRAVAALGMSYVNLPMKGVVAPSDEQIAKALALLNSPGPVFVHCQRGSDRTGTVIACYRISHDGWQRPQALKEAKSYGMGFAQLGLKHYITSFQPTNISQIVGESVQSADAPKTTASGPGQQ